MSRMSTQQRFTLLRKLLKALGLPDERIEELITRIEEWLLDEKTEKTELSYRKAKPVLTTAGWDCCPSTR
jgi:hypothetical protein